MPHDPHPRSPGAALGRAAAVLAAATLAGAVLASCSSASPAPAGPAASAGDVESQIKQVTQDYITAVNTGKVTSVPALVCARVAATLPSGAADLPESAKKAKIDSFDQIQVDGDRATALLTVSVQDDATTPPESVDMAYVNESGWKICQ